jgi:hypothetical protein
MNNKEIMEQQFPDAFAPSLEVAQDLIAKTPAFVQMPEVPTEAFEFVEQARIVNEQATAAPQPLAETTPARIQIDIIESEDGKVVAPVYADEPLTDKQKQRLEEFNARKYKPIIMDATYQGLYLDRAPVVDGTGRTQLTEAEATAATDAVLDQTITPRDLDAVTSAVGLETMLLRKEVAELQEVNKKIIAALKHLGLDTNKHFR